MNRSSRAAVLVLAGALVGALAGCATTTPSSDESPTLEAPAAPTLRSILPLAPPSEAPQTEEVTDPDPQAAAENERLEFVLAVLDREAGRKLSAEQRDGVAQAIIGAEEQHGLPVVLALAMMRQESRFNPKAKGPAGSIGLMQVKPSTAREMARRYALGWSSNRTLLDPVQNARLGLAYLAEMRRKFGKTEHAVAAYNIGPANLRRLLARGRGSLKRGPYLTKIYAHVESLSEEYGAPGSAFD